MELHGPFPWDSMENVRILHGDIFHGEMSMEIDVLILGPWNSLENFP